jgi:hypothetical protein
MGLHQCHCDDGVTVPCICVRGEDHNEAMFDIPVGWEVVTDEEAQDMGYLDENGIWDEIPEPEPEGKGFTTTEDYSEDG